MTVRETATDRLAELRREFDDAFARPHAASAASTVDFLGVRADRASYAIDLSEIAGVRACGAVAPVPSRVPGLVGLAGVQTTLVAVFDFVALLRGGAPAARRWLVVARRDRQVAFTFDAIDGLLRVEERCLLAPHEQPSSPLVRRAVDDGSVVRPVLDVGAALAALHEAVGGAGVAR